MLNRNDILHALTNNDNREHDFIYARFVYEPEDKWTVDGTIDFNFVQSVEGALILSHTVDEYDPAGVAGLAAHLTGIAAFECEQSTDQMTTSDEEALTKLAAACRRFLDVYELNR